MKLFINSCITIICTISKDSDQCAYKAAFKSWTELADLADRQAGRLEFKHSKSKFPVSD